MSAPIPTPYCYLTNYYIPNKNEHEIKNNTSIQHKEKPSKKYSSTKLKNVKKGEWIGVFWMEDLH
jgi:hypothetical protein